MNYIYSENKNLFVELAWHGFTSGLFGLLALICLYSMVSPMYAANATYAGGSMTFTSEEIDSIGNGTQVVICTVNC
jgi:hypothetical protein